MTNDPPIFDPAESLAIIKSMIETTKHAISDSSHYFLLWGWTTMLGCLTQYVLMAVVKYEHHYYAWFITPVALLFHVVFLIRDSKKQKVKTFVSEANSYLWTAVGFSFLILAIIFSKIGWQYCFPFYILFYGIGTSVSGSLLRFKPLIAGGITCFVLAGLAVYLSYENQILIASVAILISYIVPGLLLRNSFKQKQQVVFA